MSLCDIRKSSIPFIMLFFLELPNKMGVGVTIKCKKNDVCQVLGHTWFVNVVSEKVYEIHSFLHFIKGFFI